MDPSYYTIYCCQVFFSFLGPFCSFSFLFSHPRQILSSLSFSDGPKFNIDVIFRLGEERECRRRTGRFQKAALASRGEKYIGRRRSKLYRSRGHSVFDRWSVECKFNFIYITQIHQYDEVGEEEKKRSYTRGSSSTPRAIDAKKSMA